MSQENTELLPIQEVTIEVFNKDNLKEIVTRIEKEALSFVFDPETRKGREEIGSLARKVSSSKTKIDEVGKEMVAEWKSKAKKVDELRRFARERLEEVRDKVLEPRTQWEIKEEKRMSDRVRTIEGIKELSILPGLTSADDITMRLKRVAELQDSIDDWMEFSKNAEEAVESSVKKLTEALEVVKKQESEQKELEALRKEKEDREAKELEAKRLKEEQERMEQFKKEAEEKAKREAEESQKRKEAEAKAKAEAEAGLAKARAANREHRAKINRQAVEDIINIVASSVDGVKNPELLSQEIVRAIALAQIRNVVIEY